MTDENPERKRFAVQVIFGEPDWVAIGLSKDASQARREGRWDDAIACLELMRLNHGVTNTTRLPLYLCEAGRWDEGMAEFERLLSTAVERTKFHEDGRPRDELHAAHYASILMCAVLDKIRVACKRAKRLDDAAYYERLAEPLRLELVRLTELVDAEFNRKIAQHQQRRLANR